jgi:hypothetical protein
MPVHIDTPQTSDGKAIFIPVLFRGDLHSMYLGFGDDITAGTRFDGQILAKKITTTPGDVTVTWQYREWVYIAGGIMTVKAGEVGDYAEYRIIAPATVPTSAPGVGAYGKYSLGSYNMIVPAGALGTDPDWNLDLDETLNANVAFTKAVPVPAPTVVVGGSEVGTGFFDWDSETEEVTLNAQGTGGFHMFDAEVPLATFARFVLLGSNTFDMRTPSQKPKRLLPHWQHKVKIHNATDRTSGDPLELAWNIHYARENAT